MSTMHLTKPFTQARPCHSSRARRASSRSQRLTTVASARSPASTSSAFPSTQCATAFLASMLAASPAVASDLIPYANVVADVAGLDAQSAATLALVLRPVFSIGTILYVVRIVTSWYPNIDGAKFPWVVCYYPTEPFLKVTRKVIPLVGGVDVTPIVWVALLSFFNEILLGPQGILNLIQRQAGS
jgi:YggT family protein